MHVCVMHDSGLYYTTGRAHKHVPRFMAIAHAFYMRRRQQAGHSNHEIRLQSSMFPVPVSFFTVNLQDQTVRSPSSSC